VSRLIKFRGMPIEDYGDGGGCVMLRWFKRKATSPICLHDWHLVDTRTVESYNGVSADLDLFYTIGCTKCNEQRHMDECEFRHFIRTLNVKAV